MSNGKEASTIYSIIEKTIPQANNEINLFSNKVLRTRGGRIGSGMGGILEALWGYYMNQLLNRNSKVACELAWFPEHQYHDFACVEKNAKWDMDTREGEYFRIEAKSMNSRADESKAHFDVLSDQLSDYDSLLILVWEWTTIDQYHFYPKIVDGYFGLSKPLTKLRDQLHLKRGGSFVDKNSCPDDCSSQMCTHHGEPLNEQGKRERLSGPETRRPSARVSYAANFGGLVRMLKTAGVAAREEFRSIRKNEKVADEYISFIHRNFPEEEENQYTSSEWKTVAKHLKRDTNGLSKDEIIKIIRSQKNYMDLLKELL